MSNFDYDKEVGGFRIIIQHSKIKTCCGEKEAYYWVVMKKGDTGYEVVALGDEKTLEEAQKAAERYVQEG